MRKDVSHLKHLYDVQNCACDSTLIATSPSKGYTPNQVRVGELPCPIAPGLTVLQLTLPFRPSQAEVLVTAFCIFIMCLQPSQLFLARYI